MKIEQLKIYTKTFLGIVGAKKIISVVTLSVAVVAMETLSLVFLVPLLDYAILGDNKSKLVQTVLAILQSISITPSLEICLLLFLLCSFCRSWMMKLQTILCFRMAKDFSLKMFSELYYLVLHTNWLGFTTKHSSAYKHILMAENNRMEVLTGAFFTLLTRFLFTLAYICFAAYLSFLITFTILWCGLILFALLHKNLFLIHQEAKKFSHYKSKLHKLTDEHLSFFEIIKLFHLQDKFAKNLITAKNTASNSRDSIFLCRSQHQFLFTFGSSCLLCTFIFLSNKVVQLPPLQTILSIAIFSRIAALLNGLQTPIKQIFQYFPSFQQTREMYQWCSKNQDETYGKQQVVLKKSIVIDHLSFGYADQLTLENFNLKIPAQQTIALVGESGAGKSTIATLLLGLISPHQGNIYIDDQKLSAANIKSWHQQLGYVPQKNYLLEGTLRENIQCGYLAEEDALKKVVQLSALSDLVERLPLGLDSVISEKGGNFSGGEKQRIAIARCFIRNPNVIIFDEATNALDYTTESHIFQSLRQMQQKTIIIVTHRLSSIQHVDLIHYIQGGKIVESGCWSELMEKEQHFYHLWQKQRG